MTALKMPLLVNQDPPLYRVEHADAEIAAAILTAFMERQGGYMWFLPNRLKPHVAVLNVAGLAWLQERGRIWAGKRPGTTDWLIRLKPQRETAGELGGREETR